jgi:hypothetical protein
MLVAAMLFGTMILVTGTASETLLAVYGASEDPVGPPTLRIEWFPDAMPLPSGATFAFNLSTRGGDMATYVYVRRPVAQVIDELELRLAEEGWVVVDERAGVAWPDDHRFLVERHGQTWIVHVEPSVGSTTETNIIYAPG